VLFPEIRIRPIRRLVRPEATNAATCRSRRVSGTGRERVLVSWRGAHVNRHPQLHCLSRTGGTAWRDPRN
jgi:hypothetical protein